MIVSYGSTRTRSCGHTHICVCICVCLCEFFRRFFKKKGDTYSCQCICTKFCCLLCIDYKRTNSIAVSNPSILYFHWITLEVIYIIQIFLRKIWYNIVFVPIPFKKHRFSHIFEISRDCEKEIDIKEIDICTCKSNLKL